MLNCSSICTNCSSHMWSQDNFLIKVQFVTNKKEKKKNYRKNTIQERNRFCLLVIVTNKKEKKIIEKILFYLFMYLLNDIHVCASVLQHTNTHMFLDETDYLIDNKRKTKRFTTYVPIVLFFVRFPFCLAFRLVTFIFWQLILFLFFRYKIADFTLSLYKIWLALMHTYI